jgi:hypothetical protein
MRTAACLVLFSVVACASLSKESTRPDLEPWPEIRPDFRVEALRMRMHKYSITFAAEVDLTATEIERRAADSTVRRNALLWRVRGAGAFGTFQPEAVEVSRRLVDQMREIGGSIAVSPEARAQFEHKFIDPWLAERPLRDMTFVRESPMAQFAEQSRARGDTFQSVGTLEKLAVSSKR